MSRDFLNSQAEHLQMKEWAVNQQRDSLASYMGHFSMLEYFAIAENESIGRIKYNLLQKMIRPCGNPPPTEETL
ncbi:splicing factor 3b subunit 5, putative [Acanthamoeba castellanii str. Neff]|uniref:Splicing factor 3b subunit 5, putative n=1 Tax=Acanthamoeba castellanii (strain ATCC 30010 / Neff) TaxID=1257118 RepID=L8GP34_ACACF|nr:splicing factor 3b subunit 5, putative [Acanthamoeba castellanii str. Neff]ELR14735.1 splicing factor 3b subunit 5, putative [Acanthamoeba castellanii str. Neff]